MHKRPTNDAPAVLELLASLNSPAADAAWRQFLKRYSEQMVRIVREGGFTRDECNECFLFVCEKLCENRCRRLRKYQPEGSASFRSWLEVVVANLCIDWRRSLVGRPRPFRNILGLRPLEQRVFHYRFLKRFSLNACLAALQPEFPGLGAPELAEAISSVQTTLTSRQHWLLSISQAEVLSLQSDAVDEPRSFAPGPGRQAVASEEQQRLERAMAQLQPRQRQLLAMRYRQDLTLQEIARLTRLGDPFRVRRQIQAALDELERLLHT